MLDTKSWNQWSLQRLTVEFLQVTLTILNLRRHLSKSERESDSSKYPTLKLIFPSSATVVIPCTYVITWNTRITRHTIDSKQIINQDMRLEMSDDPCQDFGAHVCVTISLSNRVTEQNCGCLFTSLVTSISAILSTSNIWNWVHPSRSTSQRLKDDAVTAKSSVQAHRGGFWMN